MVFKLLRGLRSSVFSVQQGILSVLGTFDHTNSVTLNMEIRGGLLTNYLTICPKCHAKLKVSSDGKTQYCSICRYWTKIGTARLDSIMIYE